MSGRRSSSSRSRQSSRTIISDDQIIDLVSKLQRLIPEARSSSRRSRDKVYTHTLLTLTLFPTSIFLDTLVQTSN
ncbi:hypothetical protein LINGRAHAP2_LOCUS35031 [Linum grandiflorum]